MSVLDPLDYRAHGTERPAEARADFDPASAPIRRTPPNPN